MSAPTMLSPPIPHKSEVQQPAPLPAPQPAVAGPQGRGYWGDRWTIKFWILCFVLMAGINLVEAARRLIFYLFGSTPPP